MSCTSEVPRPSSAAICRLDRFRPMKERHNTQIRSGWWCPASTVPLRSSKRDAHAWQRYRCRCGCVSSCPFRTTASLPHPGQRTPSGQRCWRTKAKHFASSSKDARLTGSAVAMMTGTPRVRRPPPTAWNRHHTRTATTSLHHPGSRQEPWRFVPVSRRVGALAACGGAILLRFFGSAATGSGGVAYVERMRCDRTAEFPPFPVPNDQQTDIAEHRGEPPLDHTGSGMAFLAPGGDNRKLSRDDRVIDRHHLGEGEGRAEDLDPSVERLSPPLPGFLDADAVLQRTEHRLDGPAQCVGLDDFPCGHGDLGGDEQTRRLRQAVFILQPDPDGADRPAAEEFRQHDGGVIADDLSLTIEEQEGAGLLQRGDGLFGHLRAILGGTPALADVARWRGPVESEVLPDLADDGQPFIQGEGDHRSPHEPGVEQQTALTEEAAHDPQEHPRTGQF